MLAAAAVRRRCCSTFAKGSAVPRQRRLTAGGGGGAAASRAALAAAAAAGGAALALRQQGPRWARCDAPPLLDEGLSLGMDLTDSLIAHGKRRRIYDEKAARYDASPLWLALSNVLRRIRERGLQMCGCCAAMAASVWAQADEWTVRDSLLVWASGSAAVASALLAVLLGCQRLVFGAPVSVPHSTAAVLEKLWKERTEVEDQLLREILETAEEPSDGRGQQKQRRPAALSSLGCGGRWSLVQRAAVVSPLPPPPKSGGDSAEPAQQEYAEVLSRVLAACGYHSWLVVAPRQKQRYTKSGKARPPPSLRFSSDVLEEWTVPLQLLPSAGGKGGTEPNSLDPFAVAATGLSLRVVLRHRGRGGGAIPASVAKEGPEIVFASCEFTARPSNVVLTSGAYGDAALSSNSSSGKDQQESEEVAEDAATSTATAAARVPIETDTVGGAAADGDRQRVVLIDRWHAAGGAASEKELKTALARLRLVLDGVKVSENAPVAVQRAMLQRQLLYLGGQDMLS